MKLAVAKSDILVRIVGSLVREASKAPLILVNQSKSALDLNGVVLGDSIAISKYLLAENTNLKLSYLGKSDNDASAIDNWVKECEITWSICFKKERADSFKFLNTKLQNQTFLATNYFSFADMTMYAILYDVPFRPQDSIQSPNVVRYFDLIQHVIAKLCSDASLSIIEFDMDVIIPIVLPEPKKKSAKDALIKTDDSGKLGESIKSKEVTPLLFDPSKLDMRVGKIISVENHPDAETLYVQKIDVGEPELRTVVSGLVKFMSIEQLTGQHVVLLCNLKPAKMRGIESHAMVLCASSSDGLRVEFLEPPRGSNPGDQARFVGYDSKPELLLKPKQKIWESIAPLLKTNAEMVATYTSSSGEVSLLQIDGKNCFVKSIQGNIK